MKKILKSKWGRMALLLYVGFVLVAFVISLGCSGMFCGVNIVIPALPWVFLIGDPVFVNPTPQEIAESRMVFIYSLAINAVLFYIFGFILEKFKNRPWFNATTFWRVVILFVLGIILLNYFG